MDSDYDSNNDIFNHQSGEISEGQYQLMILNDDKTATIKYRCNKASCEGDTYKGTWELSGDVLKVWINREEMNALSDALFVEGQISQISTSELVIEKIFYNPTPDITKRIRKIKYIRIE